MISPLPSEKTVQVSNLSFYNHLEATLSRIVRQQMDRHQAIKCRQIVSNISPTELIRSTNIHHQINLEDVPSDEVTNIGNTQHIYYGDQLNVETPPPINDNFTAPILPTLNWHLRNVSPLPASKISTSWLYQAKYDNYYYYYWPNDQPTNRYGIFSNHLTNISRWRGSIIWLMHAVKGIQPIT